MADPARILFETFTEQTAVEMCQSRAPETLHLEFKRLEDSDGSFRLQSDKQRLGQAISGFANSAGGLVVWGVDARRNADGVDGAGSIVPFTNANLCLSRLIQLSPEAVDPPVDRVEHRIVRLSTGGALLLTYVPQSDAPPHMAKFSDDHYYKRSGDRFYRLEHYDLSDLFGRRPPPSLELACACQQGILVIGMRNAGRGMARYPAMQVMVTPTSLMPVDRRYGVDGNGHFGLRVVPSEASQESPIALAGGADHVIYPGSTLDIVSARPVRPITLEVAHLNVIRVQASLFADGLPPSYEVGVVRPERLMASIGGKRVPAWDSGESDKSQIPCT